MRDGFDKNTNFPWMSDDDDRQEGKPKRRQARDDFEEFKTEAIPHAKTDNEPDHLSARLDNDRATRASPSRQATDYKKFSQPVPPRHRPVANKAAPTEFVNARTTPPTPPNTPLHGEIKLPTPSTGGATSPFSRASDTSPSANVRQDHHPFLEDFRKSDRDADERELFGEAEPIDSYSVEPAYDPMAQGDASFSDGGGFLESEALEDDFTRLQKLLNQPSDATFWRDLAVVTTSATAIAQQMNDRVSNDDLDASLLNIQQLAKSIPTLPDGQQGDQTALSALLPGIDDILNDTALLTTQEQQSVHGLAFSRAQQNQIRVLKSVVAGQSLASAGRGEQGSVDESVAAHTPSKRRASKKQRGVMHSRWAQFFVGLVLLVAVVLPFYGFALVGNPPSHEFSADSTALTVYEAVGRVKPRQTVLFAIEYGPTAAGELDPSLKAMLRHTLAVGGLPILIGSNPIGMSRMEAVFAEIENDADFENALGRSIVRNQDYYLIRYLIGGPLALRGMVENPAPVFQTDLNGQPTQLSVPSFDSFSLIVVLSETSEGVRQWAEQVAPVTQTQLVGSVSAVAAPLAIPYLKVVDGYSGLLVGLQDGITYNNLLTASASLIKPIDPALVPTLAPLEFTPSSTPTPETAYAPKLPTDTLPPSLDRAVVGPGQVHIRNVAHVNAATISIVPKENSTVWLSSPHDEHPNITLQTHANSDKPGGQRSWVQAQVLELRTTDFHAQDSVTGLSGADLANFQFFSDQAGQINVDDERQFFALRSSLLIATMMIVAGNLLYLFGWLIRRRGN